MKTSCLAVSLLALLGSACDLTPEPTAREIWVDHHLAPCSGWEGQRYCFRVSEHPDGPWASHYDGLQNFTFEWGTRYRLEVTPTKLHDGTFVDAPATSLRVMEIREKVMAASGTQFDMRIDNPVEARLGYPAYLTVAGNGGQMFNGPAFTCATVELCAELQARLASDAPFTVTFAYAEPASLGIILASIRATSP